MHAATAPGPVESPPCLLCAGNDFESVYERVRAILGKPGAFDVQRCRACDLVMTRPRPAVEGLPFYYEYPDDAYEGFAEFERGSWVNQQISRYRLRVIDKAHTLTGSDHVLDIGCSSGGFLREARTGSGCKTSGIDFAQRSIDDAVDNDVTEYRVGRFEDADYADESFSVVTMFQVLEHLADPVTALRHVHRVLRPGGGAVIEVPNFDGFWRRVFGASWLPLLIPQHLVHFTPRTLRDTAQRAGFGGIELQQTMFYPLEGMASAWLRLCDARGWNPLDFVKQRERLRDKLLGAPAATAALAGFLLFEVPSQAALHAAGQAGHQILIARKT